MSVKTPVSLLCLAFLVWGGCSKEEENVPPVQIVKVRKPIIRPLPEKGNIAWLPQPEKSEGPVKQAGPKTDKFEKKVGVQAKVKPEKKDKEKEVRYPGVGKKGTVTEKEASTSRDTQPAGPRAFKELKKIRFVTTPEGEEKVLIWLNGRFPPKTFPLEGDRPRVVCDFFDARLGGNLGSSIKAGGRVIKEIRIGSYKGAEPKVRVVLDLVSRGSGDYEVQPIFYNKENIFALVVK